MGDLSFVWLEVTGKCQLSCVHCYAESGPSGTRGKMGTADWLRVIDEGIALGVRAVQFIGGEPTLHPDLTTLVLHAVDRGLQVEIFSNLVHIRRALWEIFALPGVSLATSYYSDEAGEHESRRRLMACFEEDHQVQGCAPRCGPNCEPIDCGPRCAPMVPVCGPKECAPARQFCSPNYPGPDRRCQPREQPCRPMQCNPTRP